MLICSICLTTDTVATAASEKPDIAALLMISAKTAFYRPTADIAILFYHAFDWPLKADTTHLFQAFL